MISNAEIYHNLYHYGGIWGEMYGRKISSKTQEDELIWIDQKNLTISKQGDCLIFVWGWPGPDVNFYEFKDYGITWSFIKEDLLNKISADSGRPADN